MRCVGWVCIARRNAARAPKRDGARLRVGYMFVRADDGTDSGSRRTRVAAGPFSGAVRSVRSEPSDEYWRRCPIASRFVGTETTASAPTTGRSDGTGRRCVGGFAVQRVQLAGPRSSVLGRDLVLRTRSRTAAGDGGRPSRRVPSRPRSHRRPSRDAAGVAGGRRCPSRGRPNARYSRSSRRRFPRANRLESTARPNRRESSDEGGLTRTVSRRRLSQSLTRWVGLSVRVETVRAGDPVPASGSSRKVS